MGLGLFSEPNQALLMNVSWVMGLTWTFLAGFSVQVGIGMLIIIGFASLNLLFA